MWVLIVNRKWVPERVIQYSYGCQGMVTKDITEDKAHSPPL